MSTTMWESEARKWSPLRPWAPPGSRSYPRLTLRTPGVVEIKPHTETGIRAGLEQVARRLRRRGKGVLATYMGTDSRGNPVLVGRATHVRVYATLVDLDVNKHPTPEQYNQPNQWYALGLAEVPPKIDFPPVDHAPMFGWAIESVVQKQVKAAVTLATAKKKWTTLGGPGHVADMRYRELAEFYGELGRQLRDPFYAELASELSSFGSGGGALFRAA